MGLLNEKEQQKLDIIKKVLFEGISKKEASTTLNISRRQVDRLIQRFLDEGENGFVHKNRGTISEKKVDNNIKEEVVQLYIIEYYDYNFTHFYEVIKDKFGLSYPTICNILNENDIISPEAWHKTTKLYNKKMKEAIKNKTITNEQQHLYEERQEEEKQKYLRISTLLYKFGQEVQMDATLYIWFGEIPTMLHLAVDKATKKILYGWFDYQETSQAYYILLMNVILKWGIPELIKTDKRGSFSINSKKYTKSKLNETQFGRMCKDLKIKLLSSSDPRFKPNVERENKTVKGRLKAELRHEGITEIEEANKYLNEVFIPEINKSFSYNIDENRNCMRKNEYTEEELNIIISERHKRMIDNASSIKYEGNYYIPINKETGEVVYFSNKTECTIVIAYDKTYWCYIDNVLYGLLKVEKYQEKEKQEEVKKEPKYKGHIPAPNHPWREYEKVERRKKKNGKRNNENICIRNENR